MVIGQQRMYAIFVKHFGSNAEHASEVCRVGSQKAANQIARALMDERVLERNDPSNCNSKKEFVSRYSFVQVKEVA